MVCAYPTRTPSTACSTACRPEPHTRLMVSAGTSTGTPALSAACRATFMPAPACSTHPISTSSTSDGVTWARAIASRIAMAPRSAAERSLKAPPNDPIGVRQALTSNASMSLGKSPYLIPDDERSARSGLHPFEGRIRRDFEQNQSGGRHFNDGHFGDDQVDHVEACKRQRATFHDFMTTILRGVFHR